MIVAVGDLHGDFQCVQDWLAEYDVRDTTLIQVGDVGLIPKLGPVDTNSFPWTYGYIDEWRAAFQQLGRELYERNCRMYYLRGNHDDPRYWEGTQNDRRLWATLIALQDGANNIYSARHANRNWIPAYCLGGAISVDRKLRQERGHFWRAGEAAREPVFRKYYNICRVVITHAAPTLAPPFGDPRGNGRIAGYFERDQTLYDDVQAERARLDKVYHATEGNRRYRGGRRLWLYGHYHKYMTHTVDDVDFICVGEKQFLDVTHYFK